MTRLSNAMPRSGLVDPNTPIDEFVHSNTVDLWWKMMYKPTKIKSLDVSELFASAINNIHNNESVSELFV